MQNKSNPRQRVKQSRSKQEYLINSTQKAEKIPQKPLYRIVKYESLLQAHQVRVKLWKVTSCSFAHMREDCSLFIMFGMNAKTKIDKFCSFQTGPTMKRSLQSIRKLDARGNFPIYNFISKTWKLKSLTFHFSGASFPFKRFFKCFSKSKLERFVFGHVPGQDSEYHTNAELAKIICQLKSLKNCSLQFPYPSKEETVAPRLQKLIRLQRLALVNDSSFNMWIYVNPSRFQCLQELILPMVYWNEHQTVFPSIALIPNLKKLSVHFRGPQSNPEFDSLEFITGCEKLESLAITIERVKYYSLDFLTEMYTLKEFCFKETGGKIEKGQVLKRFPNVTHLQTVRLCIRNSEFCYESIQETLKMNTNLKELELDLTVDEMNKFINSNLTLSIDALKLTLSKFNMADERLFNEMIGLFERHPQLKKLHMKFWLKYKTILKLVVETLNRLPLLEDLELVFHQAGELTSSGFNVVRDALLQLTKLRKLSIDLKNKKITSADLLEVARLWRTIPVMEKLVFEANFDKIAASAYEKFRAIAKEFKNAYIYGYPSELSRETNSFLNPKSSLWRLQYDYE